MSKHDRTKSGGFLDTLFTRSTKRGHRNTYNANGTRPLSANENDNSDMQDIENLILKLDVEEVNKRFLEILEDMNIPKDKREPLIKKNLEEKRDMLRMHLKGKQSGSIHRWRESRRGLEPFSRSAASSIKISKNPKQFIFIHSVSCAMIAFLFSQILGGKERNRFHNVLRCGKALM